VLNLYVYYQVRQMNAKNLRAKIVQIQQRLSNRTGGRYKLLRHVETTDDGLETWMEVYENVQSDFETLLQEQVNVAGIADWLHGKRNIERFVDL
jgi:DNA gyrase inhibitor GyrI